ncbi:MAG: glycosyltransferase family 4 protein [Nitrospirota bacterium]
MLKVVHILPPYNPVPPVNSAGTELRVVNVAKREKSFEPYIISGYFPHQNEREYLDGVTHIRIKIGSLYKRLFQKITRIDPNIFFRKAGKIIKDINPGIIHIHNEPKVLSGIFPYIGNIKVVVHIANEKPFDRKTMGRVDYFIVCSHFISEWLIREYRVNKDIVSTIYTGTDTDIIKPWWKTPQLRSEERKRYSLADSDTAILFAGRVIKEKGVKELIDAFDLLCRDGLNNIRLFIAGDIKESKDPSNEKAIYGRFIKEYISNRTGIHLLGTIIPSLMHRFYAMGDIFVLPSIWNDPFPTVVLEASAAGLPIAASKRGGIPEFIRDGENGILINSPEEPSSIADVIKRLIKDRELRLTLGRNARMDVEGYSWGIVAEKIENIYKKTMEANH